MRGRICELLQVSVCAAKRGVLSEALPPLRTRSVMSRATFDAPIIVPEASRIGDTVSDTFRTRPSFVWRFVS